MANSWLRLWHEMPNDPKWRTIAKVAKQPIALVQAVYLHLLVDASRHVTRGHIDTTVEDLASALDVAEAQVESIWRAMQGRVLEGSTLTGWQKRQPKREDLGDWQSGAKSAAQRKREQREREKKEREEKEGEVCYAGSHDVTLDKDTDKDTDKDKEIDKEEINREEKNREERNKKEVGKTEVVKKMNVTRAGLEKVKTQITPKDLVEEGIDPQQALEHFAVRKEKKQPMTPSAWAMMKREAAKLGWTIQEVVQRCNEQGWAGFRAQWILNQEGGQSKASETSERGRFLTQPNKQEALEQRNAKVAQAWAEDGAVDGVVDV